MTKYVLKSTIVIALEALPANELRTLSSGVWFPLRIRQRTTLFLSATLQAHRWSRLFLCPLRDAGKCKGVHFYFGTDYPSHVSLSIV